MQFEIRNSMKNHGLLDTEEASKHRLSQAEERAKNLITDYVNRMGEATGETYEIKWK